MRGKPQLEVEALLLLVLVVLLSAGLLTHCARPAARAPNGVAAEGTRFGVPDLPTTVAGWFAVGDQQHYAADDLYLYINGGAVTWIECGFRQVAAREYRSGREKRLMLEIYEMSNDDAAHCVYQQRSGGGGEVVQVGDGGKQYDYYLEFRSGRFLVTITALEVSSGPVTGLHTFAEAVERLLETFRTGDH